MEKVKIRIRKATKKDLSAIFHIEKRSYTPQLQAKHEVLKKRMELFGIWVAEVKGRVRGFFTCVPTRLDFSNIKSVKKTFLDRRKPHYLPWFENYERNKEKFNTLLVSSTAVEKEWQGKGIGKTLIKKSLEIAKKMNLQYRASALRCEYRNYFLKTKKSVDDYISEANKGKIKDRWLSLYKKLGFKLVAPLPNYEPFKGSLNYNVLAYKEIK